MTWSGHVARTGTKKSAYKVLAREPDGKRSLGRPGRRWKDIKMDLIEIGCGLDSSRSG
jgi:hypothetical protein